MQGGGRAGGAERSWLSGDWLERWGNCGARGDWRNAESGAGSLPLSPKKARDARRVAVTRWPWVGRLFWFLFQPLCYSGVSRSGLRMWVVTKCHSRWRGLWEE